MKCASNIEVNAKKSMTIGTTIGYLRSRFLEIRHNPAWAVQKYQLRVIIVNNVDNLPTNN